MENVTFLYSVMPCGRYVALFETEPRSGPTLTKPLALLQGIDAG